MKKEIKYARHRTKESLLDFFIQILEIKKDKKRQRVLQRKKISVNEYSFEIEQIIKEIGAFLQNEQQKQYIVFLLNELVEINIFITLNQETLKSSQKQLDAIISIYFFIPLLSLLLVKQNNFIISLFEKMLEQQSDKCIKVFFDTLQSKTSEENLSKAIDEALKEKGYDTARKNKQNWLNGKNFPSQEYRKKLSKSLSNHYSAISEDEFQNIFLIGVVLSKVLQNSFNTFGKKIVFIFLQHYILIDKLHHVLKKSSDIEKFSQQWQKYISLPVDYVNKFFHTQYKVLQYIQKKFSSKSFIYEDRESKNQALLLILQIIEEEKLFYMDEEVFFSTLQNQQLLYTKLFENSIDNEFFQYSEKLAEMYHYTLPKEQKSLEIEQKLYLLYEEFQQEYETLKNPYFAFLQARFYAQQRKYKEASKEYKKALEYGQFCMGKHIKSIIEEGLIVSAQLVKNKDLSLLSAKSDFTYFYKAAYFFNLLEETPNEREKYFLNDMQKQFDIYFKNLYIKNDKRDERILSPNNFIDNEEIEIDFQNPNKLLKHSPNPITQLMYVSQRRDYKSVKKLVENGADINRLKQSDNASALLLAFPPPDEFLDLLAGLEDLKLNNQELHRIKELHKIKELLIDKPLYEIAKFLIPKMTKEALDTKLIKQQESALSYAIQYGYIEIVQLLIENKVDLYQKATLKELIPLYQVLQNLWYGKGLSSLNIDSWRDKKELAKLAKANKFSSRIFDDDRQRETFQILEKKKAQSKKSRKSLIKWYKNNEEKYYKIFDILLANMTKVDIAHKDNSTPLIFATKLNEEELVKKLLKKGANIHWINDDGLRAYDYAYKNGNKNLQNILK